MYKIPSIWITVSVYYILISTLSFLIMYLVNLLFSMFLLQVGMYILIS